MFNAFFKIKSHHILFTLAVVGFIFYALSPLLFPDATGLRQPELLPVYLTLCGLGQIAKGNSIIGGGNGNKTPTQHKDTDDENKQDQTRP